MNELTRISHCLTAKTPTQDLFSLLEELPPVELTDEQLLAVTGGQARDMGGGLLGDAGILNGFLGNALGGGASNLGGGISNLGGGASTLGGGTSSGM